MSKYIDLWNVVHADFPEILTVRKNKLKRKIHKIKITIKADTPDKEKIRKNEKIKELRIKIQELELIKTALYRKLSHHVGNRLKPKTAEELLMEVE